MQVSKTLDYAVRSLSFMASSLDENITIKLVSEKQHIPHSYLAKIMRKLVQRGILSSSSGTADIVSRASLEIVIPS